MRRRAIIYARVSTDDQRDNYSIPSQIQECIAYANQMDYIIIGNQFVDPQTGYDVFESNGAIPAFVDDYTSRELSRPSLDAAISYVENVVCDVMIVHALDRLARDPYIRQTLEIELGKRECKVEYVVGNYEDSPEGEIRKDLDATFAKWENAKRIERCNRGKRKKAEAGIFVAGRIPYGYLRNDEVLGGLGINQEQAEIVKMIFDFYVEERKSIREIVRSLNKQGIPSALNRKWGKSSVHRILSNTAYIGKVYFNKHKRNGTQLIPRHESEWIDIEVTPIVEISIFQEAQKMLDENKKTSKRYPKRFYLLRGMVYCDHCKRIYGGGASKRGSQRRKADALYYRHRIISGHCRNHMISARRLEPIVWDAILNLLRNPEIIRQSYQDAVALQDQKQQYQRAHLDLLQQNKQKIDLIRQNLTLAYIDPDIQMSKHEYLEQKEGLDRKYGELISEIQGVENSLLDIPHFADIETIEAFSTQIRNHLDQHERISLQNKRKVLEMLQVQVWVLDNERIRIKGMFAPPQERLLSQVSASCAPRLRPPPGRA
ncbi:MAG: recombinase family protein [Anaerolineales bacterium]|nr:recombinase family protein [Anaerolineales bacterium]